MSSELLLALMRAMLTGAFVFTILRSVQRAPPAATAIVVSLPLLIGPAFISLSAVQPDAFVLLTAERAAQAMLAVVIMLVSTMLIFERLTLPMLMAAALAIWLACALSITADNLPWPAWVSCAIGIAALAMSHLLIPFKVGLQATASPGAPRRRVWPAALQAGVLSLTLSLFADILAPRFSAIVSSLPLATLLVISQMKKSALPGWSAVLQSVRVGMPCLYIYLLALTLLVPVAGAAGASWLAFLPSAALSLLIVFLRRRLA